jgi:hypothetical protein
MYIVYHKIISLKEKKKWRMFKRNNFNNYNRSWESFNRTSTCITS